MQQQQQQQQQEPKLIVLLAGTAAAGSNAAAAASGAAWLQLSPDSMHQHRLHSQQMCLVRIQVSGWLGNILLRIRNVTNLATGLRRQLS
jgi:CRISPR/Cas system endoribonuclease Cas6 (RAMP superfamily)